jgi:pimeloyl-ACP methyl ester carboxylesterase
MKSSSLLINIFFLLFASLHSSAQQEEMKFKIPYGNNPSVGKYAEVNGIKMYYEEYGEGAPLIVIHGNGANIHSMGYQIEYFSKNYHVIAADSRAHGKTSVGNVPLTYDLMADDWAALLNTLHIDSAYVIGWSDGGILGLLLAIHHPEKVKKLAAMGANLQPDSSAVYGWAVRLVANLDKQVDVKIANKDTTAPWSLLKMYLNLLGKQPHIPVSDLKKISAPSLILCGDKDVITLEHTDEIFENIPHAQLCVFPGATHFIPEQDPELFNATVGKFFKNPFTRPDTRTRLEKMKIE